jgi:hypothetical protein
MKSDPDNMQSMVRFLLYANEFDFEGLVASAGTFAMEAHEKNLLDVIDLYEMVYDNKKNMILFIQRLTSWYLFDLCPGRYTWLVDKRFSGIIYDRINKNVSGHVWRF